MKRTLILATLILGGMGAGHLVIGAQAAAPSVGVVNLQQLLDTYPAYKQAQGQLQQAEQNYQKELSVRLKKLEEAQKAGATKEKLMQMQKQYEKEVEPIRQRGQQLYQQLYAKLKAKIERAIADVAKSKHVEVVYDKQAVLFGGTDLTQDVAKKLK